MQTERLILRTWQDSDFADFAAMNSDPVVMEHFPKPLSNEETAAMIARINAHFERRGYGLWAVQDKQTSEFLGFTGLAYIDFEADFTPCVEIGWRFKTSAWGKGLASEAARAVLQYGFEQLGLDAIYSFTATTNTRSENVMKRIGMTKIGEFDHPKIEKGHRICRHVLYKIAVDR